MAFPDMDAGKDFDREQRRRKRTRIVSRLRREPGDVDEMLPFDDVVRALGHRSQRDLGVQTISLDSIVGTVDRRRGDFDKSFRPLSAGLRDRWKRVAAARRRGEEMPPIEVYRVGDLHFVEDGHHRVSVARALGDTTIEARVREVRTALGPGTDLRPSQLGLKHHERMFFERVPLPVPLRSRIRLTDEWRYAELASLVEARGFRESHTRGRLLSREELALLWFTQQYEPIVARLRESAAGGPGTDTDRFLRFILLRYLLAHTHESDEQVVQDVLGQVRRPTPEDDTLVHQILKEMTAKPSE